jgi:hypothetical protein
MTASFAEQLSAFAEKTKQKHDVIVRRVVLQIGASLVERSPVGNPDLWAANQNGKVAGKGYVGGRFRANWQISAGDRASGVIDAIDASGDVSMARISAFVAALQAGGVVYITNNLPYAQKLEYGHSKQAPAGMVRITAVEFQAYVDRILKELP